MSHRPSAIATKPRAARIPDAALIAAVVLLVLAAALVALTIVSAVKVRDELAQQGGALIEKITPRVPAPKSPRQVQGPANPAGPEAAKPKHVAPDQQ